MSDNASSTDHANASPRSPIRAVLLTLLMTGLGHIYCGELVAGLAWSAAGAFCGVVSLWALTTSPSSAGLAAMPMWILTIAAVAQVWWVARNAPKDYILRPYNRWYVYVLLLAISSFGAAGHGFLIRANILEAYFTPSSDMLPTLHPGDRFLADKTAYHDASIEVGDVIIFKDPEKPGRTFVKRVVALAGDTIEIRDGDVLVNDEPSVYWRNFDETDQPEDFGPEVVPAHNCYVLGDNIIKSKDSRHFGPVPYATVKGQASVLFWPPSHWSKLSPDR